MDDAELLQPTISADLLNQLEQGTKIDVIAPTQEELSKVSGVDVSKFPVFSADSNWDKFITDYESQLGVYFDTLGCNIFSSAHCVESLVNALGGDPDATNSDGKADYSERAACVNAGLNGLSGSSESQWETGLLAHGLVFEEEWPFPATQRQPVFDKTDFFKPLPNNVLQDGLKFLKRFEPTFRAVATDKASLTEALKYAPVKLFIGTGPGWNNREPEVIPRNDNPMGHAVMLRYIDDLGFHIYDQYAPYLKVLAPDYRIFYAFQTLLTKKGQNMFLANDKGTVFVITGNKDKRKIGIADLNSLGLFGDEPQVQMDTSSIPEYNTIVDAKQITHK